MTTDIHWGGRLLSVQVEYFSVETSTGSGTAGQQYSDIWAPAWQNEVSDCDEAVQNNKVYSAKGAALHRPMSNDTYFTVWAYTWDDNNTTQFASSYGSGLSLYARKRSIPGVWGDWVHIYPPE